MPFLIRRIHDDVTPRDVAAVAEVQAIMRAQFAGVAEATIAELPEKLRNPLGAKFRSVLLIAERRGHVDLGLRALAAGRMVLVRDAMLPPTPGGEGVQRSVLCCPFELTETERGQKIALGGQAGRD